MEDALRDMALFAEYNPAPLLRIDHRGVVIFANQAARDLLGEKAENVSLTSIVPSAAEIDLGRCIREGLISSHEVRLGQRDWQFTIRGLPELGVAHAYGSDITQRKRAEEELASRNRELLTLHRISEIVRGAESLSAAFREIVEEIGAATGFPIVAIELYDEARQTMLFKGVTGIPLSPGQPALEVPVEETLSGIVARTGRPMVETDAWGRPEYANETLRGLGVRTFVCVPMMVGQRVIGALSLARPGAIQLDTRLLLWAESLANYVASLTERTRAEEALRESEELYRALFEGANDAIFLHPFNPDGTFAAFLAVNDVACARLGYSRQELLQMTPADIMAPDRIAEVPQIMARLQEEGRTTFETVHRSRDGRTIPVEISTRLLDLGGKRMVLSIARDITERKQVEQFREEYVHTISHDLRTPLTIIQGQAQLLRRRLDSGEESGPERRCVEAILTGTGRMNAMLRDMLDSARLESGQLQLNLTPLDLRPFLRDLLERLAGAVEAERVRADVPENLPPVSADVNSLERILMNLLTNALKYSSPDTQVRVSVAQRADEIVISVADNGPGIPADDLPHLFQRYYRAGAARKQHEGLGLGLYITRWLVEAHGGRIWEESEVGEGSTFHFSLPLRRT